jgi:hypothetical protein
MLGVSKTVAFDLENTSTDGSKTGSSGSSPDGVDKSAREKKIRRSQEVHQVLRRVGFGADAESDSEGEIRYQRAPGMGV